MNFATNVYHYHVVQKLGFIYKKCDKRSVIMESMNIIMWRYKYLLEIAKYRAKNCLIVYLDATWYDPHDTVKEVLTDSSKGSHVSAPVSEGKKNI